MSKQLPERPNLEHLRTQAKDLLSSFRAGDPAATTLFQEHLPALQRGKSQLGLHDAQSAVARQYGFQSWTELVREVEAIRAKEGIDQTVADAFVQAAVNGEVGKCQRLVELYPGLPTHNAATALVWGDPDRLKQRLTDEPFVTTKLPPNGWLPLEYVCYSLLHLLGDERKQALLKSAELLLDHGADPNTNHSWREDRHEPLSVLYGAAGHAGNADIVRLLLERGADPNDGESIYHSAQFDREEILDLLVSHGAEFSKVLQPWGNTPMFFNAGHRKTDPGFATAMRGIDWLLERGADPNVACTGSEETVLHCAARIANPELVRRLLQFGADPKLKRKDGRTPFDLAALTGCQESMDLLREAGGANPLDPVTQQIAELAQGELDHTKITPELKEQGAWSLRKMAELGVCQGVKNLIAAGVDFRSPDDQGITALHWACFCGWIDCVRTLLANGASLDLKDNEYNSNPLGWATQGSGWSRNPQGDYYGIIEALLAASASKDQLRETIEKSEHNAERLADLRSLLE